MTFRSPLPQVVLVLERDGVELRVGEGCDIGWTDVRNLGRQHEGRAMPLPAELVDCIVRIMRAMPGAWVAEPGR